MSLFAWVLNHLQKKTKRIWSIWGKKNSFSWKWSFFSYNFDRGKMLLRMICWGVLLTHCIYCEWTCENNAPLGGSALCTAIGSPTSCDACKCGCKSIHSVLREWKLNPGKGRTFAQGFVAGVSSWVCIDFEAAWPHRVFFLKKQGSGRTRYTLTLFPLKRIKTTHVCQFVGLYKWCSGWVRRHGSMFQWWDAWEVEG